MQIPDVPPQLLAALVEAAAGQRLALVGGVVRDLLLHRHHQDPWRGLPDLDLVVEGRAASLVERLPVALERQFGQSIPFLQQPHRRYGTVELELLLPPALGGSWLVDLASARREIYAQPSHNPDVAPGTLEEDLARRDFTVNAIALLLNSGKATEAQLIDPFGGQIDLARRQLRFLHVKSLQDDPTRLVRAARYSARLGFDLSDQARRQVDMVLNQWPWAWRPGDRPEDAPAGLSTRLRMELDVLFEREPWRKALLLLQQWGGLSLVDAHLQHQTVWPQRLNWAKRLQVPLLPAMVANAGNPLALALRFQLPHRQQAWLRKMRELQDQLLITAWPTHAYGWCERLEAPGSSAQAVALAVIAGSQPRQQLLHWFYRWRHVKATVSGADLVRAGWPPGPGIRLELKRQRRAILEISS